MDNSLISPNDIFISMNPLLSHQKHFKCIGHLVRFLKERCEEGKYLFRGQTQPWPLISSIYRIKDENERTKNWKSTLDFCNWLYLKKSFANYRSSLENFVAIAQHYGYTTDLIDFTWDVEVAAYFATHGDIRVSAPGVLWVIEVEQLKALLKVFNIDDPPITEIKGLWRLENQKGIFVHDKGGQILRILGRHDFTFTHIPGKPYRTKRITKSYIYPPPNDLELETQGYEYAQAVAIPITERLPADFPAVFFHAERDSNDIKFEEKLPQRDWDSGEQWKLLQNDTFAEMGFNKPAKRAIDLSELMSCGSKDKELLIDNFVESLMDEKNKREGYSQIKIIVDKEAGGNGGDLFNVRETIQKSLSDYLLPLLYYPYSKNQIVEALKAYFKYVDFFSRNVSGMNMQEDAARYVFGEDVILGEAADSNSVATRFYLPISYFDNSIHFTQVKEQVNRQRKDASAQELVSNISVLYCVQDIKKLMSFDEAVELWAKVVLPGQHFYRGEGARIYSPYYTNIIGYA